MATIRPDEITSIIKAKIENYNSEMEVSNVGSVLEVGDGIARVYGLRNAMSNELVEFEDGKGTGKTRGYEDHLRRLRDRGEGSAPSRPWRLLFFI